jgi:hypothetical protein
MAKLIHIQSVERFDDDCPYVVVYGLCSSCGQKVYEHKPSCFPEKCPHCNEEIEKVDWESSNKK